MTGDRDPVLEEAGAVIRQLEADDPQFMRALMRRDPLAAFMVGLLREANGRHAPWIRRLVNGPRVTAALVGMGAIDQATADRLLTGGPA